MACLNIADSNEFFSAQCKSCSKLSKLLPLLPAVKLTPSENNGCCYCRPQ